MADVRDFRYGLSPHFESEVAIASMYDNDRSWDYVLLVEGLSDADFTPGLQGKVINCEPKTDSEWVACCSLGLYMADLLQSR